MTKKPEIPNDYRQIVGRGLELLAAGLKPFLEKQVGWEWPPDRQDRPPRPDDPHYQLNVMWHLWHSVFGRVLSGRERTLVSELREVRNGWAHREPFDRDDCWRALDSIERLLRAVDAPQADEVRKLKTQLGPSQEGEEEEGESKPPPPRPPDGQLTDIQRQAQGVLKELVDRAGGPSASGQISVDHLAPLRNLFNEWAHTHGESTDVGVFFAGRPGLWHALDELCPLDDPNRWDTLRKAVIASLEDDNWVRRSPPRGSAFDILEG